MRRLAMHETAVAIPLSTVRRLLMIAAPRDPEDRAMIEWVRGEVADESGHLVAIPEIDLSRPETWGGRQL